MTPEAPASSAILLPETTLFLNNAQVLSNNQRQYFLADIGLTVRDLDSDGFVTNNQPFIDALNTQRARSNKEEIAEAVVGLAHKLIGERLVRVTANVHERNAEQGALKSWQKDERSAVPKQPGSRMISINRLYVTAQLVDNHVCGGYDGGFEADATLRVSQDSKLRNSSFAEELRMQYALGVYKASCEDLALGITNFAHELGEGHLLESTARVYNTTGWAEVKWALGMQVPAFPRLGTRDELRRTMGSRQSRSSRSC